uniref:Uncharacterized protein n=1 Tax=Cacopsylla melanoneura TaxID=428564 RepID=A0A8D9F389_9HEMI
MFSFDDLTNYQNVILVVLIIVVICVCILFSVCFCFVPITHNTQRKTHRTSHRTTRQEGSNVSQISRKPKNIHQSNRRNAVPEIGVHPSVDPELQGHCSNSNVSERKYSSTKKNKTLERKISNTSISSNVSHVPPINIHITADLERNNSNLSLNVAPQCKPHGSEYADESTRISHFDSQVELHRSSSAEFNQAGGLNPSPSDLRRSKSTNLDHRSNVATPTLQRSDVNASQLNIEGVNPPEVEREDERQNYVIRKKLFDTLGVDCRGRGSV